MSKILYLDCFSGASGDMIIGALIDAGLPFEEFQRGLQSLAIGNHSIAVNRVDRSGIGATKFSVKELGHRRDLHDKEHVHRGVGEIEALVRASDLSESIKSKSIGLFRRLAEIEASIHRIPIEQVSLHEVGALDSIIDIVGAVFCFEWFSVDQIVASPLNVGGGTVECEHGTLPVPAPATLKLLEGAPIYSKGPRVELLTPTGALLVTEYASSYGPVPPMRVSQIGYGAGERDPSGMPNILRVMVGENGNDNGLIEQIVVIECEIDDMNPQIFGQLMDRLYSIGALEVFYVPIQMKKNRPGTLVTIVALPDRRKALSHLLFCETTTIGVRYQEILRERLDREKVYIDTPVGRVLFKLARISGRIVNASPEFEDCVRLAAEQKLPIKEIQAIATKAYLDKRTD